jgi:uncharacterized membrane protein
MYTKATIAKHPIHPMLIAFPVALYVTTVVALIVHVATNDPFWYRAAFWSNLGGILMAAIAAIPGVIDLVALPARSRARATGLSHAAFNVLALAMFTISAVIIGRHLFGSVILVDAAPLALGIVGLCSTTVAGALGWTLVQTHHVGVKPTEHHGLRMPGEIDDLDELIAPPMDTAVPYGSPEYPMHH